MHDARPLNDAAALQYISAAFDGLVRNPSHEDGDASQVGVIQHDERGLLLFCVISNDYEVELFQTGSAQWVAVSHQWNPLARFVLDNVTW